MKGLMTEREFLQEWEKGNQKPDSRYKNPDEYAKEMDKWERKRASALSNFLIEEERKARQEEARRREKERYERQLNAQLLQKTQADEQNRQEMMQKEIEVEEENREKLYTKEDLNIADYTQGVVMLASVAVLATAGKTGMFMGEKAADLGTALKEHMAEHRTDLLKMLNQKNYAEYIADGVLETLGAVTQDTLRSGNLKTKQMEFMQNEMVRIFQQPEHNIGFPERKIKHALLERDQGNQMQAFWAVKRMTELMSAFEYSKVLLADQARETEHFSEEELRDFMVGTFAMGELEKSRKADQLTEKALIFGKIRNVGHKSGYQEMRYGDDEIYEEIKKTDTYRKLKNMSLKEIRNMLIPHKDKNCDCREKEKAEEKSLKTEDKRVMQKRYIKDY